MLRMAFSLTLFMFSLVFTVVAFQFPFTDHSGRPGPGFFPVIIGIPLLIFTAMNLYSDMKKKQAGPEEKVYGKEMLFIIVLTAGFIFLLNILGSLISMILFMFLLLYVVNREKLVQNLLISVGVPILLFAMFDLWLNAGLPKGFLGII